MGFEFNSAYCAAKFGLEGWMEALQAEVAPFNIHTTIVNPGFFRTELLTRESATYATPAIAEYADRHAARSGNNMSRQSLFKTVDITLSHANGFTPGDMIRLSQAGFFSEVGRLQVPAK
jgi:NAD(P)-dependent dehydrogenase (short-subunit alcohol dehydrogenase family)